METRLPTQRLRRHLLPHVQTKKDDRRHLPRPNPRPYKIAAPSAPIFQLISTFRRESNPDHSLVRSEQPPHPPLRPTNFCEAFSIFERTSNTSALPDFDIGGSLFKRQNSAIPDISALDQLKFVKIRVFYRINRMGPSQVIVKPDCDGGRTRERDP